MPSSVAVGAAVEGRGAALVGSSAVFAANGGRKIDRHSHATLISLRRRRGARGPHQPPQILRQGINLLPKGLLAEARLKFRDGVEHRREQRRVRVLHSLCDEALCLDLAVRQLL